MRFIPREGTETMAVSCLTHNGSIYEIYSPRGDGNSQYWYMFSSVIFHLWDLFPARGRKPFTQNNLKVIFAPVFMRFIPREGTETAFNWALLSLVLSSRFMRFIPREGTETWNKIAFLWSAKSLIYEIYSPRGDGNPSRLLVWCHAYAQWIYEIYSPRGDGNCL